jgi:hypothetical protein
VFGTVGSAFNKDDIKGYGFIPLTGKNGSVHKIEMSFKVKKVIV